VSEHETLDPTDRSSLRPSHDGSGSASGSPGDAFMPSVGGAVEFAVDSHDRSLRSVGRLPGPDVVRAFALIGVVVMNYHGYLMFRASSEAAGPAAAFFDPFEGPLSTRFAATFVLTAGVGITLLTKRVVTDRRAAVDGAVNAVAEMRWRLVRRGLALYVLGQLLDVIWPGTIIIYYGAMFVVAGLLFALPTRWIVVIGIVAALAGWIIEAWAFRRIEDGGDISWLYQPGRESIRRYVFDLAVNGTHPLLPWLAFLCAGMIVGRSLTRPRWRWWCTGLGVALYGGAAFISAFADTPFTDVLLSTHPFDRGAIYVASALGTALIAFAGISWVADRLAAKGIGLLEPLRRAGQMTLTLYIAHILVFNLMVDWLGWVRPTGLDTALTFALGYWVVAIILGALWHRRFGRGPA
jgi:uncharacterized protein